MKKHLLIMLLLLALLAAPTALAEEWVSYWFGDIGLDLPADYQDIALGSGLFYMSDDDLVIVSVQDAAVSFEAQQAAYERMYDGGFFNQVKLNGLNMLVVEPPATLGTEVSCVVLVEHGQRTLIVTYYADTNRLDESWQAINAMIYRIGLPVATPEPHSRFVTPTPSHAPTAAPKPTPEPTSMPKPTARPTATPQPGGLRMVDPGQMKTQHDGSNLLVSFKVKNQSSKTVDSYVLYVYAVDAYDNRIYGEDMLIEAYMDKRLRPGAAAFSDYIKLSERKKIIRIFCGVSSVFYTDGSSDRFTPSDIDYQSYWVSENMDRYFY